jgi:hypothetical protein
MHRRAAALAVPLTVIALTVSSCGNIPEEWRTPAFMRMGDDQLDSRLPTVTGNVGEAPEVTFPDIEPPEEELSGVVDQGPSEEELVRADDLLIANVVQFQWTGAGEGELPGPSPPCASATPAAPPSSSRCTRRRGA